jgi:hypothetical protein
LGDDCVREKRMAVSVISLSPVTALHLPAHKFMTLLDPLTLRLFARLRPQHGVGQQLLLQASGARRALKRAVRVQW